MVDDEDACPNCDGAGYIEEDSCDARGEHISRRVTCACQEDSDDAPPELDAEHLYADGCDGPDA